jgi:hypothetical protein
MSGSGTVGDLLLWQLRTALKCAQNNASRHKQCRQHRNEYGERRDHGLQRSSCRAELYVFRWEEVESVFLPKGIPENVNILPDELCFGLRR